MTNCTIISISTNYVKIRSNGYDNEITITGGKHTIRAVAGSSTTDASCNDLLNVHPLLQIEDAEYIIDGRYTYTTDVQGRVKKISGELAAISSSRVRNADQQTYLCNILKQGTQGSDDGGHMIAKQFFGASEQINYFPQDLAMNRSPSSPNTTNPNPRPGLWYAMETEWKNARLAGSTVIVEITPVLPVNIATGAVVATSTSSSSCQVCPIIPPRTTQRVLTPATCQALQQLRNSTNNQLGINALCNKISSETTLKEVTDQLNSYQTSLTTNTIANDFLNDIKPTTLPTRHISSNLNSNFGVEQLKAWKKLYTSGFETDFEYIRTLSYRGYKDNGTPNGTTGLFVDMTNLNNTNTSVTINGVGAFDITITSNGFRNDITQTGTGTSATTNIISTCVPAVGINRGLSYSLNQTNNFLNVVPLLPNAVYLVDGYVTYRTDTEGRVRQIEATLRNNPRGRDELQQQQAKHFKNGVMSPVDHGGHMIGSQFDGIVEQINYHSQHGLTNSGGAWWRMEMEWAAVLQGNRYPADINQPAIIQAGTPQIVTVDIKPQFTGTSRRPTEFVVDFNYGGGTNQNRRISNP